MKAPAVAAVATVLFFGPGCGGELEPTGRRSGADTSAVSLSSEREIPCGPRAVLALVCQQCHSSPTRSGAPYALVSIEDVRQERDGEPTSSAMLALVEQRRMPLSPVTITDEQRSVLLDWLRSGAPTVTPRECP